MEEIKIDYDIRRNLAVHQENYDKKIASGDIPKGNCNACAAAQCTFNTTVRQILKAFELDFETKEIEQFQCDDIQDDPVAMAADLTYIDDIFDYEALPGERIEISIEKGINIAKKSGKKIRVVHSAGSIEVNWNSVLEKELKFFGLKPLNN